MISNNDTNLNLSFHPPNPCLLLLPRSLTLSRSLPPPPPPPPPTPSHAYSAGQNSVADLLLASDPALLVSAPALALVAGATNLSKMAAQCFLFHSFVPFMPHFKTQIDTTDTSSPPSLSVGTLACLWHARLFGTRLITARGLVINQGHVERDSRGPPVFQTIPPLSPVSHFRWPVLQVQGWAKGFSFLIN